MTETTELFLRRVLPDPGEGVRFFSVGALRGDFDHVPFREAGGLADHALRVSGEGRDAYFSLAGFGPAGGRKAEHAVSARALWLDLDIDPERIRSPYGDREEALKALREFAESSGLPEPLLVDSGRSFHVYWPFTAGVSPDRWTALADRFKRAIRASGFRPDPARTADLASVLRVPGTLNRKYDPPPTVRVVSWGDGPRDAEFYEGLFAGVQAPPAPHGRGKAPQRLFHRHLGDDRTRNPHRLFVNCPQLEKAGTAEASRDSWMLMLGVMSFCRKGREAAHVISRQDEDRYDARELDRQFDTVGLGPPRCDTFEFRDPEPCARCRWRGKVTSPVQLDRPPAQAPEPAIAGDGPDPESEPEPEPYVDDEFEVVPGRGVYQIFPPKNPGGDSFSLLINENEFYLDEIHADTEDARERRYLKFRVRPTGGPFKTVNFSMSEDFAGVNMNLWLANHGLLPVKPAYNKGMRNFMGSYIAKLQQRKPVVERKTHFGWAKYVDPSTGLKEEGFVVGRSMFTREGARSVSLDERCERLASKEYVSAGTLAAWKAIPELYRVLDQPEGQLFMCAAFAAPFMRYGTGTATNLIMVLWDSKGGKGKTSLLQAVNSVWGHPVALTSAKNDTASARYQVLGVRRNLPYCMDELTTMKDADLSNLLYDIANGREKRKSKSGGIDLVNTGSWATMTFLTSNRSVYEMMRGLSMQTTAESMRAVEVPCRFASYAGTEDGRVIEQVLRLMDTNYGLAGPAFMNWLFTARSGAFAEATARAIDWDERYRFSAEERFWTYGLGLTLAAGRLACEAGLLNYDIDVLEKWILGTLLPRMRLNVGSSAVDGQSIMTMFMNENLDHTLVVASAARPKRNQGGEAPPSDGAGDGWLMREPSRALHIRLELDTRLVYVEARYFEAWCLEHRVSVDAVLEDLMLDNKYRLGDRSPIALGKGVGHLSRGRIMCYKFKDLEVPDAYVTQD